jgi:drug/metabolite transporter (DMT)-like permease
VTFWHDVRRQWWLLLHCSALVFGERFNSTRYAGMALIVMGLAFIVLPTANAVSEPERARMVRKS